MAESLKKVFVLLTLLALTPSVFAADEAPLDVVDLLRREQQASPTNTWERPVNLLRGHIIFIRSGRRPWKLGIRNDRGYKYDYIISRDTVIWRGKKKITQDEFIRTAKTGDWIEVKSTNNKDMDPITVFIRYPEKTEVLSVTGSVKAVMRGRSPRLLVKDAAGKEYNLSLPAYVRVKENGEAIKLAEFLDKANHVKHLKAEYALGDKGDKVARTLDILPGTAPAPAPKPKTPAAPKPPAGPPANPRSVSAVVKAFKPGHQPRLLLQDPDGKELNMRVADESKIWLEGEAVSVRKFFERVRTVRYYEVTYGDLGGELVTVSIVGTNTAKATA